MKLSDRKKRNIMPIFQNGEKEDTWALLTHQSHLHASEIMEKVFLEDVSRQMKAGR